MDGKDSTLFKKCRRILPLTLALYGFVSALPGTSVAVAAGEAPKDGKEEGKPSAIVSNAKYDDIALFGRVINFIEKQYVDKVNTRELVYGAIKGMLETLDPHSNFMPPDVYSQLKSDTAGKFGGLGIEVWVNKDGVLTIVTPMEGTPAWKAGVKPGDRIMKINGESTKGMSIVEATTRIRGEIGSEVKFTVARDGAPKPIDFKMKRVTIDVKSVKAELLEEKFAYIKLNHFQEKTAQEVKAALGKMEGKRKISGMILDLRNNPGGLLDEAVDTVNLFVDKGPIVSTIGRNKEEKDVKYAKSGIARLDFPMVVLVNGSSASAAEIVSGALKDHKRALVAGSRTFGKGSVQTVIPLADDVGLKLTIARYYTPSGVSIQAKGIEPDLQLDDFDPETIKRIRKRNRFMSEADLKNHIEASAKVKGEKTDDSSSDEEKVAEAKDAPPRPLDPKDDYQVQQALNYLKTMNFQVPTAAQLTQQM
ncbi:MAG: S41 family peptidase [Proteobacteria bacterium]|nr:MAG: S41 family peptidase [Pseudomonadota bacterium]